VGRLVGGSNLCLGKRYEVLKDEWVGQKCSFLALHNYVMTPYQLPIPWPSRSLGRHTWISQKGNRHSRPPVLRHFFGMVNVVPAVPVSFPERHFNLWTGLRVYADPGRYETPSIYHRLPLFIQKPQIFFAFISAGMGGAPAWSQPTSLFASPLVY